MSEPARAVFLSYARDDAAAWRIADALRSTGIEVWSDQNELEGGDAWDTKIRKKIQLCALFVPVILAATQARGEEYFRLEWKLAVDRSHLMADDAPFLFPVVMDDTTDAAARVPDKFRDVQWTRLNVKDTPESLAARVGRLLAKADDGARKKSFRALFSRFCFKLRPISFPMGSISRSFLRLGSVWVGCRCLLAANPAFVRAGRPAKAPRPQNP